MKLKCVVLYLIEIPMHCTSFVIFTYILCVYLVSILLPYVVIVLYQSSRSYELVTCTICMRHTV